MLLQQRERRLAGDGHGVVVFPVCLDLGVEQGLGEQLNEQPALDVCLSQRRRVEARLCAQDERGMLEPCWRCKDAARAGR